MPKEDYQIVLYDIINGYSIYNHGNYGEIFIKHNSHIDNSKLERKFQYFFNIAKQKGIPTYKEKEKFIIENGLWTNKHESELKQYTEFLKTLKESSSKDYIFSRRKIIKQQVAESENKLNSLLLKKNHFIGNTAESNARNQCFYFQIENSFYRDELLSNKLIKNNLDEAEFQEFTNIYLEYNNKVNYKLIKRVALLPNFSNLFYLCNDNAYYLYGKPVIQLTNYQIDLFIYAKSFKNLMSQYGERFPKNMTEPDDIMEWFEINQNAAKAGVLDNDSEGGVTSIMGANKEDLRMLGVDDSQIVDIGKKIRENGGTLTAEQLFKLNNG